MITRSRREVQSDESVTRISQTIGDRSALASALDLPLERLAYSDAADALFRMKAPASFVARIDPADPSDPLLRQILPRHQETETVAGYEDDPVGDLAAGRVPGLIHKYAGRALLIVTGACAIHCRYCFRRNYPYRKQRLDVEQACDYLSRKTGIREVILSGGDPLTLSNQRLVKLIEALERIPHLTTLRIHSRIPVVAPERLDPDLLALLGQGRLKRVVVIHANHPNELGASARAACQALSEQGAMLLNQSVLLRGVNDCAETLAALSLRLFEAGVLPYYLHLLDHARGVAHFDIPREEARALHDALCAQLPGYLVPRLVEEIPGERSKRVIAGEPAGS